MCDELLHEYAVISGLQQSSHGGADVLLMLSPEAPVDGHSNVRCCMSEEIGQRPRSSPPAST
eukprot:893701-Prymnesium_polylepis.1